MKLKEMQRKKNDHSLIIVYYRLLITHIIAPIEAVTPQPRRDQKGARSMSG